MSLKNSIEILNGLVSNDKVYKELYNMVSVEKDRSKPLFRYLDNDSLAVIRKRLEELYSNKDIKLTAWQTLDELTFKFILLSVGDDVDIDKLISNISTTLQYFIPTAEFPYDTLAKVLKQNPIFIVLILLDFITITD